MAFAINYGIMIIDFYLYSQHEIANFKPVVERLLDQGMDAAFIIEPPGVHTAFGSRTESKNKYKDDKEGDIYALVTDEVFDRITGELKKSNVRHFTRGRYHADVVISTQNAAWIHRYRSVKIRASYGVDSNDYEYSAQKNNGYDGIITHGPYSSQLFAEQIPNVNVFQAGYPKYDRFFSAHIDKNALLTKWGIDSDKPVVSYFPTWAESSSLSWSIPGLVEIAKKYTVVVKPHHNTLLFEQERLSELEAHPNIFVIKDAFDMSEFLSVSHVALCDITSGSYAESLFAGLPVVGMHPDAYIYKTKLPDQVYNSTLHAHSSENLISLFEKNDFRAADDEIVGLLFDSDRNGKDAEKFVNALFEILANRLRVSEIHPKSFFPFSVSDDINRESGEAVLFGANIESDTDFRKFPLQVPGGSRHIFHNPDFALHWLHQQSGLRGYSTIRFFCDDRISDEHHFAAILHKLAQLCDIKTAIEVFFSQSLAWARNINQDLIRQTGFQITGYSDGSSQQPLILEKAEHQNTYVDVAIACGKPELSVIIPTYNRLPVLQKCIQALKNQTLSPDKFEVLICDDGSDDDTVSWLQGIHADFRLHVMQQTNKGPAIARNKAIQKATGTIAVFMNDDTLLDPDALEIHLKLHQFLGDEKVAVLGRFDLLPEYTNSILGFLLQYTNLLFKYNQFTPDSYYDFNHFYTCNISVPLEDVKQVGGFDEDFFIQAEDIELGYKLSKLGYRVYFSPEIQSWHDHEYTEVIQVGKLALNRAHGAMILNAKHPDIGHYNRLTKDEIVRVKKNYHKRASIIEQRLQAFANLDILDRLRVSQQQFQEIAVKAQSLVLSIYGHFHDKGILESPHIKTIVERNEKSKRSNANEGLAPGLTSIIILNLNGFEHITKCVESILKNTGDLPYEIIVVDNGSTDGSLAYLRSVPGLQVIANPENVGAPYARNQAMALAKGEYMMFLDNDTILPPNWLATFLNHFKNHPDMHIIGPKSNYVSGDQIAPGARYQTYEEFVAFAEKLRNHNQGKITKTYRLILFAMMIRREVAEKLGGYDTGYEKWGHEDDDYIIRANIAGFGTGIAHDVYVHHTGSQTESKASLDYEALLATNRHYFLTKFGLNPDDFDPQIIPVQELLANSFSVERDRTPLPEPNQILPLLMPVNLPRNEAHAELLEQAVFTKVASDKDYYSLLVHKIRLNRLDEALKMTQERRESFPEDWDSLYYQAHIAYRLGKTDIAEQLLIKVLENKPEHIQAINNLAVISWQKNEREMGIQLLQNAVMLDDSNATSFENLADMYLATGKVDLALKNYEKAYYLNDQSIPTLRQLGRIYENKGETIKSRYFFDLAQKEEELVSA